MTKIEIGKIYNDSSFVGVDDKGEFTLIVTKICSENVWFYYLDHPDNSEFKIHLESAEKSWTKLSK